MHIQCTLQIKVGGSSAAVVSALRMSNPRIECVHTGRVNTVVIIIYISRRAKISKLSGPKANICNVRTRKKHRVQDIVSALLI